MRLDHVRIRGLGPFRDEVSLDLSELGDARLVAVCGENGAGKTSLLELALPGAFYRRMPTQGTLRERATTRDALLEVMVTGAASYTIRHLVDAVSGKGESVVLDGAGNPVSGSTKVSSFDDWAARTLPPEAVLLASMFGAQQDRGFLGGTPSERKAILLRARGIERYEAWATAAGERARAAKAALDVTRARLDEARRAGANVADAERALGEATRAAARADADLAQARQKLAALEEQARAAEVARAAHAAHTARSVELRARAQTLESKRADLEARVTACQQTLAKEPQICAAAAELEDLRKQRDELAQQLSAQSAREEAATERARTARKQGEDAGRHHDRATARLHELGRVLEQGEAIARAEAELAEVERALPELRRAVEAAESARDALSTAVVAGAEERIQALRSGLVAVTEARTLDDAQEAAQGALIGDDEGVLAAVEHPARRAEARKAVEAARDRLAQTETRQSRLAALARRAGELTAAREQIAALRVERDQHAHAALAAESQVNQAYQERERLNETLGALGDRDRALTQRWDALRPLAEQLPLVALAASKLEERRSQLAEVSGELEAARAALAELGPAPEAVPSVDVEPARRDVDAHEATARRAHQSVAVATAELDRARANEGQVRELEARQRAEETELSDWTRLAEDLGRKGLQAAEIDGVGPELTALVNDLLHTAHGPRFTVRIDTQRSSADGKKTIEGCAVTVIDSVRGREDEGARFSGGERVIIGEALALALSMLACQSSGLRGITLVRDETGAALDPGNAEVYVRMLRRAAEQVGADRVLFVTHSPEIRELADARITVAGGRLLVEGAPPAPVAVERAGRAAA